MYPVGLLSEAAALPGTLGLGLFNPAAASRSSDSTWHIGVASMTTPADIAASAQAVGVGRRWGGRTYTLSLLRAAVGGLVRTDSDPLTVGNDVAYSTSVGSLAVSSGIGERVAWGAAVRIHTGQVDTEKRAAVGFDAGVLAEHLTRVDLRLGAATYLASPFSRREEAPTLMAGSDLRVFGADSARTARAGLALSHTAGRGSEQLLFGSVRYGIWELRGGPARTSAYGAVSVRTRVAVAVRHAGYVVGIAREETPAGLQPSYQFVLSSRLP
jgi:hypothetical protein